MEIKVFKFGGASIATVDRIVNVGKIIRSYGDVNILIVVSALGKITNALEKVISKYISDNSPKLESLLADILEQHLRIGDSLGIDVNVLSESYSRHISNQQQFIDLKEEFTDAFIYDQIICLGEIFSTLLLQAYLSKDDLPCKWLDVRDMISTNDTYTDAKVDIVNTENDISDIVYNEFQTNPLVITQGFIAKDSSGYTTTLGREGSDYTAALIAYSINAAELTIWKDVPGILTGDPKLFDTATLISKLSYREAIEMTYYGAKVIHPKTIRPIQNRKITLNVRSFLDPNSSGTVISESGSESYPPIIVFQDDMLLLQIFTKDFTFIAEEHLSQIFDRLTAHRIKVSVMRNSAVSFTLCVSNPGEKRMTHFLDELGDNFSYTIADNLQLLTVRHFENELLEKLTKDKIILFEETMKQTVQLVMECSIY